MKQKILARTHLTALPKGEVELTIRDTEIAGFTLRIREQTSTYYYNGSANGKRFIMRIGDATTISVQEARDAVLDARRLARNGVNPVAAAAEQNRLDKLSTSTLADVEAHYDKHWKRGNLHTQKSAPSPSGIKSDRKDRQAALKFFEGVSLTQIDAKMVRNFIMHLVEQDNSSSWQNKAYGAARRLMDHAVTLNLADGNPFLMVKGPKGGADRTRFLSKREVQMIWEATLKVDHGMQNYGRLVRFLMAMPVRISIAQNLRWKDVDLEGRTITIPADAEGNKAKEPIVLPLNDIAIDVINEASEEWRPADRHVFLGRNGGRTSASGTTKSRLDDASGVTDWWHHDLRRTSVTLAAEAFEDFDEDAADLWLMHKRKGVKGTYQLAKRRSAMARVANQWNTVLAGITGQTNVEPTSNVTKLSRN